MAMMEWSSRLSVGLKSFDDEHKVLIKMINDLHDAMMAGRSKDVLADILDRLVEYTRTHFAHEEQVMRQYSYPDLAKHQAEHKALTDKAQAIQKEVRERATSALSMKTMSFLSTWLTTHIQGTDAKYSTFLGEKGVH